PFLCHLSSSSRRRHTRFSRDWSSDVCSSDLIEQVGSPEQLYSSPESLFTAMFLGDSNVFDLGDSSFDAQARWEEETWAVDPRTGIGRASCRERAGSPEVRG